MKNYSKTKSVIIFVIVGLVFVLGTLLSFVPAQIGIKDYESLIGAISLSHDSADTLTAVYDFDENEETDINKAIELIGDAIYKAGYGTANVYTLDNNKLKIEVVKPSVSENIESLKEFLGYLGSGKVLIRSVDNTTTTIEKDPTLIEIDGWKHITNVKKTSMKDYVGVEVEFNKEGKELYTALNGKKSYIFAGGKEFPNSSNEYEVTTGSGSYSMTFWFQDVEYQNYYYYTFLAGTLPIELDKDSLDIVYQEANLISSEDKLSSYSNSLVFTKQTALIFSVIAIAAIMVILFVYLIIKHKMLGVFFVITSLISLYTQLFVLQSMPWLEVGLSSFVAIGLLQIFNFTLITTLLSKFTKEYSYGKSIETSFEDAQRKVLPICFDSIIVFIIGAVSIAFFAQFELTSIASILLCGIIFNGLSTLLLFPQLVYCYHAFKTEPKDYSLTEREDA